jgi:hypothetical protein
MAVGAELEEFGKAAAVVDDIRVAEVYEKAGAKVYDLDSSIIREWRAIARDTAWKDYASRSENCARLIKLAMDSGA